MSFTEMLTQPTRYLLNKGITVDYIRQSNPVTATSRPYLFAAVPVAVMEGTVKAVWIGFKASAYMLSYGTLFKGFDSEKEIETLLSYVKIGCRTAVLITNPEFNYYCCVGSKTTWSFRGGNKIELSSAIAVQQLFCNYFINKAWANHLVHPASASLGDRIKAQFESKICARINYLLLALTASIETPVRALDVFVRYIAFKSCNEHQYGYGYSRLGAQYKLAIAAEKVCEGFMGVIFNHHCLNIAISGV
jgi:hypothetical protein